MFVDFCNQPMVGNKMTYITIIGLMESSQKINDNFIFEGKIVKNMKSF